MKSSANAKLEVIYLDNHLLVVDKPAGLLTQPNSTNAPNLEDQAKAFIKEKYHKPGRVFLIPIHRLDKPVSGLVVFARTSKALSRLNEQMRQKSIQKFYFALIEGTLKNKTGTLKHTLSHGSHRAHVSNSPQAKEALLSYEVLQEKSDTTLVKIELHTGRYHQIRAQWSHEGHPIVGDTKYGSTRTFPQGIIALHHGILKLEHPVSKEKLLFETRKRYKDFQNLT